jgi:hypothetical protein
MTPVQYKVFLTHSIESPSQHPPRQRLRSNRLFGILTEQPRKAAFSNEVFPKGVDGKFRPLLVRLHND